MTTTTDAPTGQVGARGAPDTGSDDPRVVVDPRFRARRIAVRKGAGRRRLTRLLVLIAVAVVALGTVIVLRSPILDVDEIAVVGSARTDDAAVRAVAGIDLGAPILLADLGDAAEAIGALPWVADVEVTRELPGRVVVRITDREAAAVVSGAGRAVVVDRDGRILDDAPPTALPPYVQVIVADAPSEPGDLAISPADADGGLELAAIDLASRLRTNPSGVVAAVHLDPDLRLQLIDGGVVRLGDAADLDAKIEAFRTVHARVDQRCLAALDLRVPTHPVLTRVEGCS